MADKTPKVMSSKQVVKRLSEVSGLTRPAAKKVIKALDMVIREALKNGHTQVVIGHSVSIEVAKVTKRGYKTYIRQHYTGKTLEVYVPPNRGWLNGRILPSLRKFYSDVLGTKPDELAWHISMEQQEGIEDAENESVESP